MAQEITVDLGVKPTLDTRATNSLISDLEKSLRKIQRGTHLSLAKRVSRVYDQLIEEGLASTPTAARLAFTKLSGGSFAQRQQGVLRLAEGITAKSLSLKQQEAKRQQTISSLSARADLLRQKVDFFNEEPDENNKTVLISGIIGLRREVLKLYQEYRVNRRQIPPLLRQIAQNTSSMKRQVSDWDDREKPSAGSGNSMLAFTKKLTGVATVASALAMVARKGVQAVVTALQRGEQAMRLRAAYGADVNWGDVRARAGIFNMSTESAAAPAKYASDFTQRMMWGEISEREIVGLSRAGRWGRMVMSGEARKNPLAAQQAFEEMVASTEQSKMRSILRQLGLPEDLMQYNIQGYDKETRAEYYQKFAEIGEKEWEAAVMMYDAANQYEVFTQQLSELVAKMSANTVQYASPQGREFARRMGVTTWDERTFVPSNNPNLRAIETVGHVAGITPITKLLSMMGDVVLSKETPNNITQTVNNNITIQGNADENTVAALRDEMSRPQAISSWFQQAQLMGGRTKY